ncbi:hypothetical protein [Planctomonas psychrotolerans]|uniref:hypothetical protein n=1 Tax=Planctomonas psychrotolerans TaxID=2528712 RepID=UPI0012390630|nr:hypothetical protein [Planctomonas psychrotolerans]
MNPEASSRAVAMCAASALHPYLLARAGSVIPAPTAPGTPDSAPSFPPLSSPANSSRAEGVLSVLRAHLRGREAELTTVNEAMHAPEDAALWRRFERVLTDEVRSNAALAERLRALLLPTEPRLDEVDSFFGKGITSGSGRGTAAERDPGPEASVAPDEATNAAGAAGSDEGWNRLLTDVEERGTLLNYYEPPEKSHPGDPSESSEPG